MSHQYDFVAVGDILIDAFIKLNKDMADVSIDLDTGRKTLHMPFGGKIPYDDVVTVPAVGNSPNAAVAAHRLGLETALVTNIGNDKFGKECLDALRQESIHTDFVKIHEGKKTNYHYVLRYGAERTILIQHETYPYSLPDFPVPPRYIYFSSVGEHGIAFHHEIAKYVKDNAETKLVFQPGTFQIKLGVEELRDLYEVTEIFFCNLEEAQEILKTTERHVPTLIRGLRALGPKMPVITDGPNGAYVIDADDQAWHMPMYPDPSDPVDRTGAGDSFSATFTSAIALGFSPEEALSWGPINSMSVVQYVGAQAGLLTREKLEEYLTHRPAEYIPTKIS
ncbi:MAG: carbohydrate kinase family protein [Candidatus Pacebacteria bacterium]|nr:carbohydrate kinase family protein [Candidatus Paceibacterota bacterium]MBP9842535.1 carbohydrate kinase family protein [Candidatus Paceibacterota bacterium]